MAVKLTTMLPTELRGVTQVKWAQNCHSTKLPSTCDTVFRDTYVSFTGIDGSTIMYSLISCNSVSSTRKYMFVDDVVRFELLLAYGSSVVSPCIATGLIRDCARSGLIIGMFSVLRASTVSCSVCNDKKWIETVCKVCRGSGTVQCGNCITLAQNGICSICRGHHIAECHGCNGMTVVQSSCHACTQSEQIRKLDNAIRDSSNAWDARMSSFRQ
jgi:hypothetical protein